MPLEVRERDGRLELRDAREVGEPVARARVPARTARGQVLCRNWTCDSEDVADLLARRRVVEEDEVALTGLARDGPAGAGLDSREARRETVLCVVAHGLDPDIEAEAVLPSKLDDGDALGTVRPVVLPADNPVAARWIVAMGAEVTRAELELDAQALLGAAGFAPRDAVWVGRADRLDANLVLARPLGEEADDSHFVDGCRVHDPVREAFGAGRHGWMLVKIGWAKSSNSNGQCRPPKSECATFAPKDRDTQGS